MKHPRLLFIPVAIVATLATAATLALNIIIAHGISTWTSPMKVVATIGSVLEAVLLALLISILAIHVLKPTTSTGHPNAIWFGLELLASTLATAASIVVLIQMRATTDLPATILDAPLSAYLVGLAVTLGSAFASQLMCFLLHHLFGRSSSSGQAFSLRAESRYTPEMRLKSIPYNKTAVSLPRTRGRSSGDDQSRPNTSSGRSTAETMSSIRTSISHVVRPFSSKTRLLSTSSRSVRGGGASFDSTSFHSRPSFAQDSFDSWDTSGVEPHHRQNTLDTFPTSPHRFLETIPASPTTSRSPSPGYPLDLEAPPKQSSRSRSYSPVPRAQREPSVSSQNSPSELHIHPLFRSDSPTPPPQVTPGTVVIAAPNGGKVISERSLTRMRSGSLPTTPSPLSRQGSFDSFRKKTPSPNTERLAPPEELEERKMTPPIPEWILNAGSSTSLNEATVRKLREKPSTPTLSIRSGI